MLTHLTQGNDDESCGLYSVAMVIGKTVDEVARLFGRTGRVSSTDIAEVLLRQGFGDGRSRDVLNNEPALDGRGILILYKRDGSCGHAVAYENGVIYDPDNSFLIYGAEELLFIYNANWFEWDIAANISADPVVTREFAVGKRKSEEETK